MFMSSTLQEPFDKLYGKYGAVVVDNKDEDHLGRITVRVPQLDDMQFLARPCLPYGHFFIPPKDALVWVEFEAGNALESDSAIWVGTWYAKGKTPAEAAISPPDDRVIQTASGHTIELMDKEGEEKITIRHKDNASVSIDKNGSILITNKDGAVVELKGNQVRVSAQKIVLEGSSVALGTGASEPTILGQTFAPLYAVHTHTTAVGPSGPPGPPPVVSPFPWLTTAVTVK